LDKSPAFQFYPADWLDVRVMRMTYEAQGVYMRLLCHMWRDSKDQCSMAADPSAIASVLGLPMAKTKALLRQIQWKDDPIFVEQDGKYISRRLQRVKAQQVQKSHAKSIAGKKGADSRWQSHASAMPPAIVLPMANDSSSSSSSSSSASASGEEKKAPSTPATISTEPLRYLVSVARECKILGHPKAITEHIDGWLAGAKAAVIEEALRNNPGQAIQDIHKLCFSKFHAKLDAKAKAEKEKLEAKNRLDYDIQQTFAPTNGKQEKPRDESYLSAD